MTLADTHIKLIECPRDAMQGWKNFVPTEKKVEYINALLQVGFDTIDFGSFVSPKIIPQMADTKEVITKLNTGKTNTRLLAIIANVRGAEDALQFEKIDFLGYPFSVSETFQQRNTNRSIEDSLTIVEKIHELCESAQRELVIYISMGFGNPYNEPFSEELVYKWIKRLRESGIKIISLADTVGVATASQVYNMSNYVVKEFPDLEVGVHLHSTPGNREKKIDAAIRAGIRRFDGALKGIGGCPMADDELVGNIDSEWLIEYFKQQSLITNINTNALNESLKIAGEIFIQP